MAARPSVRRGPLPRLPELEKALPRVTQGVEGLVGETEVAPGVSPLLARLDHAVAQESLGLHPLQGDEDGGSGHFLAGAALQLGDDLHAVGLGTEAENREEDLVLELSEGRGGHEAVLLNA
jgi:hypothetical protein